MKLFLNLGSYLFHPLLMPLMGTAIYFYITPRFLEQELVTANLFAIGIVTIIIPFVIFFLLRNLGQVETIFLHKVEERKFPLMIQCILLLLIIKVVFNPYDNPELYYFFIGILFSSFTALIMVLFKVKVSLHQIGVSGILLFLIGLSAHFKVNLLMTISFFLFANGWVASSRLQAEAHSYPELIMGVVIGALPQLILFNMWL